MRVGRDAPKVLYLDLTVLPKGTFERAAQRAQYWLRKSKPEEVLTVDVGAARSLGISPLPEGPVVTAQQGSAPPRGR